MTDEQTLAVNAAIHTASAAAASIGAGLAQIPGSDSVPIIAIQTTTVIAIGKAFGKTLDQSAAKAAIGTATAIVNDIDFRLIHAYIKRRRQYEICACRN